MNNKYDKLKLENQLCFPLYAAAKEIVRQYKPFLDRLDMTYTQYIAMMVLWEHREVTVKELGEYLYLDSGTLTPLLKTMEKKGWVERNRSKEDDHVSASTGLEEKNRKVEEYVQQVQEHNEEVSLLNLEDIPATITLENNITYTQLSEYIADNNLETVQLQARGIDANGERVTFASKTYKGLFETDQMIKRLAQDNNIEFVGYNAMYVLIDSTQIISVQNDDLTFLIETSIADVAATLSNEKSVEFPHSLAWTIEELH